MLPGRSVIRFDHVLLEEIARAASAAYPFEGCGALLGERGHARVMLPLPNAELDRPRVRFEVSPKDYLHVEREAETRGLLLLGFWHSHPDHPARPSPTDRAYAWPGLLTLVIGVERGDPGEMTAWDVPGQEEPFRQLDLEIAPRKETS